MRIILKILAAPFWAVLSVSWLLLVFVFCTARVLLEIFSGFGVLLSLVLFVTGQTTGGIVFGIIAFLISPVGLPMIAEWIIDRLGDAKGALGNFITA